MHCSIHSQGVLIGQTLYLSGAIGLDPKTGQFVGEGIEEQTRQVIPSMERNQIMEDFFQVLKNLGAILQAAGASYKNGQKTDPFLFRSSISYSFSGEMQCFSQRYE